MKHYGDITKINGFDVEPTSLIVGGSPCQDLSVAGKRAGLAGERSGLFMEQIRIIKEMREADVQRGRVGANIRPRLMVWENVPGTFSSNNGDDFGAVLQETIKVVCEEVPPIPMPDKGWATSGCLVDVDRKWSVAWRVLDAQFWGVPQRRRRIALVADFGGMSAPEILFERNGVSRDIEESRETRERTSADAERGVGKTISFQERAGCAEGVKEYSSNETEREHCQRSTINSCCNSITCMATQQGGAEIRTDDLAPTLTAAAGMSGNNQPVVCIQGNCIDRADTARCNGKGCTEDVCYTLNTIDRHAIFDARGNGGGEISPTIIGDHNNRITDYSAIVVKGFPPLSQKMDTGKGNVPLVMEDVISLDRAAFNQGINAQYSFEVKDDGVNSTLVSKGPGAVCYGISAYESNAMKSNNPNSGVYEAVTARTLDLNGGNPSCNQGGIAVVQGALKNYIVRRLTPLECERLQGFPDNYTDIGDYTDSKGKKRKTNDGARYKALGNSIAIPPWTYVLSRLFPYCEEKTMASLFDGIGGFPLIWERLGGKAVWASEIEDFPIAVTKKHFSEEGV